MKLTRILDTSEIDTSNPEIAQDLDIDLSRIDKMKHEKMPQNCDAYLLKIRPSQNTFYPGFYRFTFEFKYGNLVDGKFNPCGESVFSQTEALPML